MRKTLNKITTMLLTAFQITSVVTTLGTVSVLSVSAEEDIVTHITEETTFVNSSYYIDNPLGVAGNFHLVGFNSVKTGTHTNGNILAKTLYYNSNFGTNGLSGEVSYIQNIGNDISSFQFSGNSNKTVVVGTNVVVGTTDNGNAWTLNGAKVDNPIRGNYPNSIMQDSDTVQFIDIDAVKVESVTLNQTMVAYDDFGIEKNLSDQNTQNITIQNNATANVVNLKASDFNVNNPLTVKGFEKGKHATLIINMDLAGITSFSFAGSEIEYTDGTKASQGEVTQWQDGNVIWNFYDSSDPEGLYRGKLNNTRATAGLILAPAATVDLTQNFNGTVIANDIVVSAESHRTDFTGKTIVPGGKDGEKPGDGEKEEEKEPQETEEPTPSESPEPSATPTVEPTPTPSSTPEPTPSETPEVTPEPTPSATPENTPEPTPTVEPTSTPEPSNTPEPTVEPTPSTEPTSTPEPSVKPVPSETPEPSEEPEPSETPVPSETPIEEPAETYTVTFTDETGNVITTTNYNYEEIAVIPENPTEEDDERCNCEFEGWEVVEGAPLDAEKKVRNNVKYRAVFKKTCKVTVVFEDEDGSELSHEYYTVGENVVYPENPSKEEDSGYIYSFNGWDFTSGSEFGEGGIVTGDATYTATYVKTEKETNKTEDKTAVINNNITNNNINTVTTNTVTVNQSQSSPSPKTETSYNIPDTGKYTIVNTSDRSAVNTGVGQKIAVYVGIAVVSGLVAIFLLQKTKQKN